MATKRLAWDEYFAAQALMDCNCLTCKRASVGAVIVTIIKLFQQDIMDLFQERNTASIMNA